MGLTILPELLLIPIVLTENINWPTSPNRGGKDLRPNRKASFPPIPTLSAQCGQERKFKMLIRQNHILIFFAFCFIFVGVLVFPESGAGEISIPAGTRLKAEADMTIDVNDKGEITLKSTKRGAEAKIIVQNAKLVIYKGAVILVNPEGSIKDNLKYYEGKIEFQEKFLLNDKKVSRSIIFINGKPSKVKSITIDGKIAKDTKFWIDNTNYIDLSNPVFALQLQIKSVQ